MYVYVCGWVHLVDVRYVFLYIHNLIGTNFRGVALYVLHFLCIYVCMYVICMLSVCMCDSGWAPGRIIKLHYTEVNWPPNM